MDKVSAVEQTSKPGFWYRPMHDYEILLGHVFQHHNGFRILALMLSALAGWWLYVPIHELLHAAGCIWSGGEVTRLELSPEYGAYFLQQWFPWVAVGSDYAGQLTGFDTRQHDGIYLATILLPYVLTIFPGMWLFYRALLSDWSHLSAWIVTGFSLAMVLAPFISIFGDMYEAASILMSRGVSSLQPALELDRWRSDDFFLLVQQLWPDRLWSDAFGLLGSLLLSIILSWSIYHAGALLASWSVKQDAN